MGLKLSDFDPPADDTVDAGPAIREMIAYGVTHDISDFDFDRRAYRIDTEVTLPKITSGNTHWARYNGNGATFAVKDNVIAFNRDSTDEALQDNRYWSPRFSDMSFIAQTTGADAGAIRYWDSANLVCDRIRISGIDFGLEALFGLYGRYRNCLAVGVKNAFRVLGRGGPTGARWTATGNTNSNEFRIEQCRAHTSDSSAVQYLIEDAARVTMQSCVSEGDSCDKCVVVNSYTNHGSGLQYQDDHSTQINDHWCEISAGVTDVFEFAVRKAVVSINGLRWGGQVGTACTNNLINASASQKALFIIQQGAWQEIVADGKTQWFHRGQAGSNVSKWIFRDNLIQSGHAFNDSAKWDALTPPAVADFEEIGTFNYS